MSRNDIVLHTFTVYRRSGGYVAVQFEVAGSGGVHEIGQVAAAATLDGIRDLLADVAPQADARFPRADTDASDIVETWL